jgi:trimeric autotransporter adhesin
MQKILRGRLCPEALLFILCFGLSFYTTRAQVSGTFTINSTLPTGGNNFQTFNDAVASLAGGVNGPVIFNVAPNTGPYNEQVIMTTIAGTSAANTITFNGNGDTLAFGATNAFQSAVLKLDGADYVTIDSLNVKVLGTSFGFGIQMINDADHNTVIRCKIISSVSTAAAATSYAGIVVNSSPTDPRGISTSSYCDSNTITRDTVIGGFYGITCASDASDAPYNPGFTECEGNRITNNVIMDPCGYGIYVSGTTNTLIEHNDISQPTRTIFVAFMGIYSHLENYGLQISKNKVHDLLNSNKRVILQLDGIHIEKTVCMAAAPNKVCNNLIYNFNGDGYQYGIYTISSDYVNIYNNTVLLEDTASKAAAGIYTRGFALFGIEPTGTEFKNNNVIIRRAGATTRTCIYLGIANSGMVPDYNNLLIESAACTSTTCYIGHRGTNSGPNYSTLTDWRGIGKDANSISMDPVYKDPLNADFSPTRIPFDNKGIALGVVDDIFDTSRSAVKPDIGAFEFTICKELNTPVLKADSVGSYMVRFAWTAVPNTPAYLVSRDGVTWVTPSSGPLGLTHTISGLNARDKLNLTVKAIGTRYDCPPVFSNNVEVQTVSDQVFIPNTFTPNNNGKNDVFGVFSNIVNRLHLMVYNQWGEKVYETTDVKGRWDGTYKGKPQPVGVYVYVAVMELADRSKVTHKGTFNLIR